MRLTIDKAGIKPLQNLFSLFATARILCYVDCSLPAQVLNLHPLLSDDGRHVGVHGDRCPRLPPLERLARPRRVLPLHQVDPLHLEMLQCLVLDYDIVFSTVWEYSMRVVSED